MVAGEPMQLKLQPSEKELVRILAHDWAKRYPRPRRAGRPSTTSAYLMHLVHRDALVNRPNYTQRKLSTVDERARIELNQETVPEDEFGSKRRLERPSWARSIARRVAPKDSPTRQTQLVDRWVYMDFMWAFLPPRDGMTAHQLLAPQYHALAARQPILERRPILFSVGDLDALHDGGAYNWR